MATSRDSRISKPARRSQTCDTCKARHQKCNGARPQCGNCELRGIACSYGSVRSRISDRIPSNELLNIASTSPVSAHGRLTITDAQYASLRDQLLDDILRGFGAKGERYHPTAPTAAAQEDQKEAIARFQVGSASLSAFHKQVSDLIKIYTSLDGESPSPAPDNDREHALSKTTRNARKILGDSLPPRDQSQRLLNMFLDYQNTLFYVCERNKVQEVLNLMYEDAGQVSLAWFCQMFLIFAVGVQFDDVDEEEGVAYHELGRKYIDEALDEDPENNLWVVRAMLLICFYQPPTKWTTLWIYLDTAIRRAHRHQLDLGQNPSQGLTDEEYQEWRQLWLTVISFDRWVAIFLGRLPHIKESISRDPIFKDEYFLQGLDRCATQNNITSLAIIMGYILRDVYFSGMPDQAMFQRYQKHLETWLADLPSPLRQQIQSGLIETSPPDQHEAAFNLHFMYRGAWMLLMRPMLVQSVEMAGTASNSTESAASLPSATLADGKLCVQNAVQLVASSAALLSTSLPPKRIFMPVFFLVYAAHIVILGIAWRMWAQPGTSQDQSMETTTIATVIRVLDFCGQRNMFARKYSLLIKELRSQLDGEPSSAERIPPAHTSSSISSVSPQASSQMTGVQSTSSLNSSTHVYTPLGNLSGQESRADQPLASVEPRERSLSADFDGMAFNPSWLEQFRSPGLADDPLFLESFAALQNPSLFGSREEV